MSMLSIDNHKSAPLHMVYGIVTRRRWQILVTFFLTITAIAVITFRTPKQYEARMKILVKNERAGIVVSPSSSDQSMYQGEVSETQINTEIELLNNDDLLRQVVKACSLDKTELTSGKNGHALEAAALESAVASLQHSLRISAVKKANIIEVVYTAPSPRQASSVLRQLAADYLESHLRLHGTPGTREFFLNQAAHYRNELKDIDAKLTEFRIKNNIVLFEPQQEELLRKASESNSMLLATEASIREYAREIADARTQIAAEQPRVVTQNHIVSNQNSVERLSTMLVELTNRRTQLLSKFQPDDRLVQEVSQEINDTQAALQSAKNLTGSDQTTDVNPVRQSLALELAKEQAELAGFEGRRQTLIQQTDEYRSQLKQLARASDEYNDLIRRQKEVEDNYLLYGRKAEEARIAESLDKQKIANVVIAENPVEPLYPSKPNVKLNLELGIVFAAFLSLGIAFCLEYLEQPFPRIEAGAQLRLTSPEGERPALGTVELSDDLEALTGLPVLAVTRRA